MRRLELMRFILLHNTPVVLVSPFCPELSGFAVAPEHPLVREMYIPSALQQLFYHQKEKNS